MLNRCDLSVRMVHGSLPFGGALHRRDLPGAVVLCKGRYYEALVRKSVTAEGHRRLVLIGRMKFWEQQAVVSSIAAALLVLSFLPTVAPTTYVQH